MTPNDFKDSSKKHVIQAALEVLANVVKLGKCEDSNLDVTRSSSLPTLLISIVRNLVKSDVILNVHRNGAGLYSDFLGCRAHLKLPIGGNRYFTA